MPNAAVEHRMTMEESEQLKKIPGPCLRAERGVKYNRIVSMSKTLESSTV